MEEKMKIEKEQRRIKLKEMKRKKQMKIILFCLVILILTAVIFSRSFNKPEPTSLPNSNPPEPEIKPLIVEGSKTDVIIKNNQQKDISVNVTYRIFSNWFGMDSQASQVFDVGANTEKSFNVYNNIGCATAPCSVSIIDYSEV